MNVVKDFQNKLLGRRELVLELESEQNPGTESVNKAVIDQFKSKDDLVVIKRVGSSFGSNKFVIEAFIYDSVEIRDKVEPKKKEKKK